MNDSKRENKLKISKTKTKFLELKFKNNVERNRNDNNVKLGMLWNKEPWKMKRKFFKTAVRPTSECWAINKKNKIKINIAKMRMLK